MFPGYTIHAQMKFFRGGISSILTSRGSNLSKKNFRGVYEGGVKNFLQTGDKEGEKIFLGLLRGGI